MWQNACSNVVMAKPPQENVRLPPEFREAARAMIPRVGPKKKWQIYAAAVLAFLQLPTRKQDELLAGIRAADYPGGSYKPLIDAARLEGEPDAVATDLPTPRPNGTPAGPAAPVESPAPKHGGGRRAKGRH